MTRSVIPTRSAVMPGNVRFMGAGFVFKDSIEGFAADSCGGTTVVIGKSGTRYYLGEEGERELGKDVP